MPSAKSGTSCNLISPSAPNKAAEADNADPGEGKKGASGDGTGGGATSGDQNSQIFVPPTKKKGGANQTDKKSWIEIELVDLDGKPVPGEKFQITLPDQKIAGGTLDENGQGRVEGIDPGTCKITFPNLEKQAWKAK